MCIFVYACPPKEIYGRTYISLISGYTVNGNRLLEFRVSAESGQVGQEFRVRAATLWLKADIRHPRPTKCKSTDIYVFKFVKPLRGSIKLNSEVSQFLSYFYVTHFN